MSKRDAEEITIRPAKPDDIPRMCDLLADLFTLESDFKPDVVKQMMSLSMLVAPRPSRVGGTAGCRVVKGASSSCWRGSTYPTASSLVLVAVMDRKVVGMATVQTLVSTAEGGPVGLVEDVIVDREFRGRGIGARLLDAIMAWGKRRTLKRIQLLADRDNGPALDFYAKHGWSTTSLICLRKML